MSIEIGKTTAKEKSPFLKPAFYLNPGHTTELRKSAPELYSKLQERGLLKSDKKNIFLEASIPQFNELILGITSKDKRVIMTELQRELGQNGDEMFEFYHSTGQDYKGGDNSTDTIESIRIFHLSLWRHINTVRAVVLCGQFDAPAIKQILGQTAESFQQNASLLQESDNLVMEVLNNPDNLAINTT